jgi:hypothetical protein
MAVTTTQIEATNVEGPMAGEPLTQAVVERIHAGLATVLVGPEQEEWVFPAHLLPPEATDGSVLILEGSGRNFHVIGIGAGRDGVEERLSRALSRRRPIVFPLPRREIPVLVPFADQSTRPSRLMRDLSHTSRPNRSRHR